MAAAIPIRIALEEVVAASTRVSNSVEKVQNMVTRAAFVLIAMGMFAVSSSQRIPARSVRARSFRRGCANAPVSSAATRPTVRPVSSKGSAIWVLRRAVAGTIAHVML